MTARPVKRPAPALAKKQLPRLLPVDLYELTDEDKRRFDEERALGMVDPKDSVLVRKAMAVDPKLIGSIKFRAIAGRLLTVAGSQQQNNTAKRTLVGLAAPQIGEPWRIIVVDTKISLQRKNPGHLECFIDPEIVWRSRETEEGREGCFSAGPVWGLVRRALAVKVRAYTPTGKKIERVFEDFTARIIQHEIDHLDGIRFPDRIRSDKKRHWVHSEEIPMYPKHIKHWPRLCSQERWHNFRSSQVALGVHPLTADRVQPK